MPQDMSQVPMNYRPAMQYTGRMRDLLYAPGYQGLQNDLVKMERDKLQRQYDVETSPEAHLLFSLRERDRLQKQTEQEARQREAERQQRLMGMQQWGAGVLAKKEARDREMEQRKYQEQQQALQFARQQAAARESRAASEAASALAYDRSRESADTSYNRQLEILRMQGRLPS